MAYWEFLLQKEGDHDWLPLETAHVEISEGRYRIIAHTSYCEIPVNIRLSRLLADQIPPKRKTLRRTGQTNSNGLMVVIPFTHLTPGSWTVTCRSALVADANVANQETWEYGVQLQVLAIESGVEYWDTESDEAAIAEQFSVNVATAEVLAPDDPSTDVSRFTQDRIASSEAAFSRQSSPEVAPEVAFVEQFDIEDLPLRLQLKHQALVAQSQTPIILQGQVTSFSQVEGLSHEGTLWVQLRNPENGTLIREKASAVSIAALPCRFEVSITLPQAIATRLLVGELGLWTATEPPQLLAIQGFTITLNLDALLEAVANQAERLSTATFEDLAVDSSPSAPTDSDDTVQGDENVTEDSNPQVLSSLSPRQIPFRQIYLPSTGLTLPPVIYRPLDKRAIGAPSLPPLANQPTRERPNPQEPSPASPLKPLSLPPIGRSLEPPSLVEDVEPSAPPTPDLELPSLEPSPQSQAASESVSSTTVDSSPAANEATPVFQPDFQGRFWHRLSALAEEAQKAAAERKTQLESAGVVDDLEAATVPSLERPTTDLQEDGGDRNYEVVIYETDAAQVSLDAAEKPPETASVEVLPPTEHDIDEEIPVPVPELLLPKGELIAGDSLPITIKLPTYPRRLAVKVWVTDIQSRTLADRPRWLMNWTPTNSGEQTAFLQLQVPLGSMEAQFEAISIDLATQRESYKTTITRSILPANLPDTSPEDIL
ncbi:hypothetical protein PN498_24375 [Oscillatoria sp. CS-180]|uniref:hypothetical protein n=1 Tax=Oscillatoria sp. CS-180 TaxID=3021720 RepID=UPI00232DB514|nr:hypothetical protein [Oscillatoria sp. CS-180]MDB9529151.1 hypothetical protein [Oscillatoria sp. CS-180]